MPANIANVAEARAANAAAAAAAAEAGMDTWTFLLTNNDPVLEARARPLREKVKPKLYDPSVLLPRPTPRKRNPLDGRDLVKFPVTRENYKAASTNLLPLLLKSDKEIARTSAKTPTGPEFNELFERGLTPICQAIVGTRMLQRIKNAHKTVRDFFLASSNATQCNNVIGMFEAGRSTCWICGVTIGEGEQECEHKLPVVLALLLTGLYDTKLYEALNRVTQRKYIDFLKLEYGWSHERCNQLKSNTSYLRPEEGDTVRLSPDEDTIEAALQAIVRKGDTQAWKPSSEELRTLIGNLTEWETTRRGAVREEMNKICTPINARALSKAQLVAHFKYGVLTRAKILLERTIPRPSERLSKTAKRAVQSYLQSEDPEGGVRRMQHGGAPPFEDVLTAVQDYVHERYLSDVFREADLTGVSGVASIDGLIETIAGDQEDCLKRQAIAVTALEAALLDVAYPSGSDPLAMFDTAIERFVSQAFVVTYAAVVEEGAANAAAAASAGPGPAAAQTPSRPPRVDTTGTLVSTGLLSPGDERSPRSTEPQTASRDGSVASSVQATPVREPKPAQPASLATFQASEAIEVPESPRSVGGRFQVGPRPKWL
jgi:hypothetical protein